MKNVSGSTFIISAPMETGINTLTFITLLPAVHSNQLVVRDYQINSSNVQFFSNCCQDMVSCAIKQNISAIK